MCFPTADAQRFQKLLKAIKRKEKLSDSDYEFLRKNYYPGIFLDHYKKLTGKYPDLNVARC